MIEKKILITGASGFVGSMVCERLKSEGLVVVEVVGPTSSVTICNSSRLVHGELSSSFDWSRHLLGVDSIVHCAARVHVMDDDAMDPLAEFRKVNVEGTLRLAHQAASAGVRRFVFLSSIKVNGEGTELGHPFCAEDAPAPQDPYGISKMEAEQGLRHLAARTGMDVVIIRPPLIYGPKVKANFASMLRWIKRGVPLPLKAVSANRRSLVYIQNLVDLICLCIDHPKAANQTFLVSDDEDVSTEILLRKIAHAFGCPSRLLYVPPWLIKFFAKIVGRPGIAERLCGSLQVDITKTKELLGWKPKFFMSEGLRVTALSMLGEGKK